MKKILFIILFTSTLGCKIEKNSTSKSVERIIDLSEFLKYSNDFKPLISIHRGGGEEIGFPENCIESFDRYFKLFSKNDTPLIIECDVELTKDSSLIMMHDNSLNRTTTGTGKIIEKNWYELNQLKLKDNSGNITDFKIPRLEEILIWGRGKVIFTLDVKRNTPYEKVIEIVRKTKSENNVVIITYDANQAKKVFDIAPNLMISASIRDQKEYERHQILNIPDKNLVAFIGTREPNKEFNSFLHQKKICTILGTLGNLDKMAEKGSNDLYLKWWNSGADILSTDRPIEVNKVLNK